MTSDEDHNAEWQKILSRTVDPMDVIERLINPVGADDGSLRDFDRETGAMICVMLRYTGDKTWNPEPELRWAWDKIGGIGIYPPASGYVEGMGIGSGRAPYFLESVDEVIKLTQWWCRSNNVSDTSLISRIIINSVDELADEDETDMIPRISRALLLNLVQEYLFKKVVGAIETYKGK